MVTNLKKAVCDLDCFNCKFDDCINDLLEIEDYVESENLDRDIISERRQKKARKMSALAKKRKKRYFTKKSLQISALRLSSQPRTALRA